MNSKQRRLYARRVVPKLQLRAAALVVQGRLGGNAKKYVLDAFDEKTPYFLRTAESVIALREYIT